jgi:hypothetical protein
LSTQPPATPFRLVFSAAPSFDTAKSKGIIKIANHEDNKDLTLQVRLLDGDGTLLYVSPMLSPGQRIDSDYLTKKDLKAGDYPVQEVFDFYNQDDGSHFYSISANVTLCIKN